MRLPSCAWFGLRRQRVLAARVARRRDRYLPCLELLEDRLALAVLTVDSALDVPLAGKTNLRQALTNYAAGDIINFGIADGTQIIAVGSDLPTINRTVTIDGSAPPAFLSQTIRIDGAGAGANADGLTIDAADSVVKALTITRFDGNGILLQSDSKNALIQGCVIGTDMTIPGGDDTLGNQNSGVYIDVGSTGNTIGGTLSDPRQAN